ncbi:MAG: DUF1080 domain-containing protein [Flavobacteriaceae bacterium]
MKKTSKFYAGLSLLLVLLTALSNCKTEKAEGLLLFREGETGWIEGGDSQWSFANNELIGVADSSAGFVMTKDSYKNFELSLEFNPDSTINSGVFVRCSNIALSNIDCYEMNIWDLHPDQKSRTGSVVSRAEAAAYVETLNSWNTYKIVCEGKNIKTWVNETKTIDIENEDLIEGYIALQAAETGTIKFRNVRLKLLE